MCSKTEQLAKCTVPYTQLGSKLHFKHSPLNSEHATPPGHDLAISSYEDYNYLVYFLVYYYCIILILYLFTIICWRGIHIGLFHCKINHTICNKCIM